MRAPDEHGAEQRAWDVVRSAYRERPAARAHRSRWPLALIPALVAVVGGLALSPAGATVSRLIRQALGVPHAARALYSLPAPGRLLLSGPGGTWTVSADGSSRRLGSWRQADWSPHGLYIAVARADELAAVDPRGVPRWTLHRPAVSDPRWYSPSGFRIGYLSGRQLRVVAGDGTSDRLVASQVRPVAPAWRPGHPYQLAYINRHGALVLRDADTRRVIWTARAPRARTLDWSANGSRLLAVGHRGARVYGPSGRLVAQLAMPTGTPAIDGTLSPNGNTLALVRGGNTPGVALAHLDRRRVALSPVLSGVGVRQATWSPDGRWLLVSWPTADQWVFVHVIGTPRIRAVSRIAQQFGNGSAPGNAPRLEGWCCTRRGPTG
jgi:hypothetical protein